MGSADRSIAEPLLCLPTISVNDPKRNIQIALVSRLIENSDAVPLLLHRQIILKQLHTIGDTKLNSLTIG